MLGFRKSTIDGLVIFIYILGYTLFDREGLIKYFYITQLLFSGYYFFRFNPLLNINLSNRDFYLPKIYLAFAILCAYSTLYSIDAQNSFNRAVTTFIISFNLFCFADYCLKVKKSEDYVYFALCFTSIINLIFFVSIPSYNEFFYDSWRFMGTRDNPNYLATLQLLTIFFCSYKLVVEKNGLIWNTIIIITALILITATGSKKGIFGAIILLITYFASFKTKNKIKTALTIYLITIALFYFIDIEVISNALNFSRVTKRIDEFAKLEGTSTNERFYFLKQGFEAFLKSPILGNGIDSNKVAFGTYSHSNFIEILSGLGFIGFICFYSIYLLIVNSVLKIKENKVRLIFLFFLSILFFLDSAQVIYYYKFSILQLLIIYQLANFHIRKQKLDFIHI